jgi:hypothetical protein
MATTLETYTVLAKSAAFAASKTCRVPATLTLRIRSIVDFLPPSS